ncbi:MAG: ABC transporter permease, partial [SAR324 cluster bacterium]|nr:ABC transporter permease [SAR324 cluster bacterium]
MADPLDTENGSKASSDERLRDVSFLSRQLNKPELGAISGAVLVFVFFGLTAGGTGMFAPDGILNWSTVSAQLGLIAIGACLLMIAGEFDLSIGSMIGFAGIMIAVPTVYWDWPVWLSIIFAFAGAMSIGFINGYIVVRTGLPSFIVSLAFLFILRGLTIGLSQFFTNRTIIGGVRDIAEEQNDWMAPLFGGKAFQGFFQWLGDNGWIETFADGTPLVSGIPAVILWFLG